MSLRIYIKRDVEDVESDMWGLFRALKAMEISRPPTVYILGMEDREWDDFEQSVSYLADFHEEDGLLKLRRIR